MPLNLRSAFQWSAMLSLLLMSLFCAGGVSSITVNTTSGLIVGSNVFGAATFLGVPYAEPPIGEKRFAKTVFKSRQEGLYNATYYRPRCMQLPLNGMVDEDCLYLNIFAPLPFGSRARSVMVWVHGGGYVVGSGQDHPGTLIALYNDVVVVNINYRLGALGFYNLMDENADGNWGLWDQTMALVWVQRNIAEFGGNPDDVTIFGESAGAGSVTQLALSPYTESLFSRVIAESGTAFGPWSNNANPVKPARDLGRLLGCPTVWNRAFVDCMRSLPASEITSSQHALPNPTAFTPTYGTNFIPYSPDELLTTRSDTKEARRLAKLDFIIGMNIDEGGFYYTGFLQRIGVNGTNGVSQHVFDDVFVKAINTSFSNDNEPVSEKLIAPLKFMYTDWANLDSDIARGKQLVKFLADTSFAAPIVRFARGCAALKRKWNFADSSGVYVYLFKHRGSWLPMEPWRSGPDHTDEIPFVFGYPFAPQFQTSVQEQAFSTSVMAYWTNFAKTGNPNSPMIDNLPTIWQKYEQESQRYLALDVDMDSDSTGQYLYNDRVEFWLDYFPAQQKIFQAEPIPNKCV